MGLATCIGHHYSIVVRNLRIFPIIFEMKKKSKGTEKEKGR
jgi:hypothetical protein